MKAVFKAEVIALPPDAERRALRLGTLRTERRHNLPGVDELLALDGDGGYRRRHLKATRTCYKHANGRGTRGVHLYWNLDAGPVYQARYRLVAGGPWERRYLYVTADGRLLDATGEEVRRWLANVTSGSMS